MSTKVFGINVHIAGIPTFFPGQDTKGHQCVLTVIDNIKRGDKEYKSETTLKFWGKKAQHAALYLKKGMCISYEGRMDSYTSESGQVKADGTKILNRKNEISIETFSFGPETKASLKARIEGNIAKLVGLGRIVAGSITADELMAIDTIPAYDYNPMMAAQSGLYGNARVWNKAANSWMAGTGTVTTPVGAPAGNPSITPEALAAAMAALNAAQNLQANNAGVATGNTPVDAFNVS